jgi:transposase
MSQLKTSLSHFWNQVYGFLFPIIEEELGELTAKQKQLISTLEMIRIEEFVKVSSGAGRPPEDRKAIARAFVAKAVYNIDSTRMLIDRLKTDSQLRRICGWINPGSVPEEWSFSRAFADYANSNLASRVHETLIKNKYEGQIVGHISRDSTEIEAREKPQKADSKKAASEIKFPVGRPRKDEKRPQPEPTRLERQEKMTLAEMEADLPRACNVGSKKNSKGFKETWIGYKLHLDAADGQIPISCILSSASLHDSQVAIPLAKMSEKRVVNLYDLMDSAYDAEPIKNCSKSLNHVPIIDHNPRRGEKIEFDPPTQERYKERTTVERVYSRLKDEFGGRMIRVRGNTKVFAHLMFGILALTADQLMRFLT